MVSLLPAPVQPAASLLLLLLLLLPGLLGGLGSSHTTAAEGQVSLMAMAQLLLPFAPQVRQQATP